MSAAPPVQARLEALERARPQANGWWRASCPAHDDAYASFGWRPSTTDDGRATVILKCQTGCTSEAILGALGMVASDLYAPRHGEAGPARPATVRTTEHEIRDAAGELRATHVRRDRADGSKTFSWRSADGSWGLGGRSVTSLPLYGTEMVASWPADAVVVIVEGEKAADALRRAGRHALATVTGADTAGRAPDAAVFEPLRGRRVVLWPDADPPGHAHMLAVAGRLAGIAAEVRWLAPPEDAPRGWDAADALGLAEDPAAALGALHARVGPVPPDASRADPGTRSDDRRRLDVIRGSDVRPLAVEWLWRGYLPRGMLSLLDGDPGLGKSTVAADIAARVTTGRPMPDGSPGPAGDVLVFSAEDAIEQVIVPRLIAAGADMDRVRIVRGSVAPGDDDAVAVTLPDDLDAIGDALEGVALAIVDPLMAYLGGEVNSHRDQDVRRVLAALSRMADETGAALVIVRHLNKATGGSAIYRGGGSIGIIGAARAAYIFGRDPDDEDLVLMASSKINVGIRPATMAYRLVDAPLPGHPDVSVARVAWQGTSDRGAEDIVRPRSGEDREDGADAGSFLRDLLADGPVPVTDIRAAAAGNGIAWRTVERAKSSLGIVARKAGRPGESGQHWTWSLPEDRHEAPKTAEDRHSPGWRSSADVGGLRGDGPPPCPRCGRPMVAVPGRDTAVCTDPGCPPRTPRTCPSCRHEHPVGTTCATCPECVPVPA